MIHGYTFEVHDSSPIVLVFVKDTTQLKLRLKLFQKADSFPQRLRACLSAGCGYMWDSLLRPISFLVVGFAFALPLTVLERVDLHPVIVCARYTSSRHGRIRSKVSGRITPLQQGCSKSGTVGICTQLHLRKIGAMFIITVCLNASANAVLEARFHSPTSSSQALKPDSKPSAWSHQSFAGIMIVCINAYCRFCVSGAYLPCIRRPAPFDSSTDRTRVRTLPFRYQGQ